MRFRYPFRGRYPVLALDVTTYSKNTTVTNRTCNFEPSINFEPSHLPCLFETGTVFCIHSQCRQVRIPGRKSLYASFITAFIFLRHVIHQFVFLVFASPCGDRKTWLKIVGTGFRNWANSRHAIEKKKWQWKVMKVKSNRYLLIYKYYVGHTHCGVI
jgi:hypothetical protein